MKRIAAKQLRCCLVASLFFSMSLTAAPCLAQQVILQLDLADAVNLDEASNTIQAHLKRVPEFIKNEEWDDAVDTLRRVIESEGDRLLPMPSPDGRSDGFQQFVTVRTFGHWQLANWHQAAPQALKVYRQRVDPLAERWLNDGIQARSRTLLERVVDEMFVSSFGDDALFYLGDVLLEQGDLTGARHCWESISPQLRTPTAYQPIFNAAPGRPLWMALRGIDLEAKWQDIQPFLTQTPAKIGWLAYPDTDVDLASVRARLVLVSILERSRQRAQIELELLRKLYPDAQGRVGGRSGKFVDLLSDLMEASQDWPSLIDGSKWSMFGGAAERCKLAQSVSDLSGGSLWSHKLNAAKYSSELLGATHTRVAETQGKLLHYHPAIVAGRAYWAEVDRIKAVDLATGAAIWGVSDVAPTDSDYASIYRHRELVGAVDRQRPLVGIWRSTLSIQDERLFARMGSPVTKLGVRQTVLKSHQGTIIGLDLRAEGKMLNGFPLVPEDTSWSFEGTPVAVGNRLLIAMRRRDDVGAQIYVACFDLSNGELIRRRRVCGGETVSQNQWSEITHNLLTVDQSTVYFNTNMGIVTALRVTDGTIHWLTRYPRIKVRSDDPDLSNLHLFRDLTPCVFHGGLVFVAPADCDQVFALDAATGSMVWQTGPERATDAVHLLGVVGDHLIASGQRLYWIDKHTGSINRQFPGPGKLAPNFASSGRRGFGRGSIARDRIYWPLQKEILVFAAANGAADIRSEPKLLQRIDLSLRKVNGGNLVLADGVILIAGADSISAFGTFPSDEEKNDE